MHNETTENPDSLPAPGAQLKAAREACGMKIQDAALQLHLQVSTIEAIENSAYDQLPAPAYVRGYLRNYAKLLGLDGDQLVTAYAHADQNEPRIEMPVRPASQVSSSDRPVQIFTFIISLGLVLLLLAWWQSRNVQDDLSLDLWSKPTSNNETAAGEADSIQPTQESIETLEQPAGLDYPIRVIRHPQITRLDPVDTNTDSDSVSLMTGEDQTIATTVDSSTNEPADTANATTPTDNTTPVAPASDAGGITNDPALVLDVNSESWIEIQDANGTRLYMGLATAGEQLRFTGTLPLDVVIGNADGVQAQFRGEPIDLEVSTRSGVARFQVGE